MNRASVHLIGASGVRFAGQFAIFAIVARVLGPHEAGRYALGLAVAAPVFMVASLGLRTVYLTLNPAVDARHVESLRVASAAVAVAVVSGVTAALDPTLVVVGTTVAITKALDASSELYAAILQDDGRFRTVSIAAAATTTASTVAATVVLLLGGDLAAALVASVVAVAATTAACRSVTMDARRRAPRPALWERRGEAWRRTTVAGLPAGLSLGISSLVVTTPQYALQASHGPAAVALLSTLLNLPAAVNIVLSGLAQASLTRSGGPDAARVASRAGALARGARWAVLTVPLTLLALVASWLVFPVALGPQFSVTLATALPLTAASLFAPLVSSTANALAIRNLYARSLWATAASLAGSVALAALAVPAHGLVGALWAVTGSLAARTVLAALLLGRDAWHR